MRLVAIPRILVVGLWVSYLWQGILFGQTGETPVPQEGATAAPISGPQIVSVSAFGAYYSHGLPSTGSSLQTGTTNLPSDVGGGASLTFQWTKFTERTTFALTYTPSYTAQLRYSALDALNHTVSFNASRKLTPLWALSFSAAANYTTTEQFLFSPTASSDVVSVPSTFNQFSSGLLAGNFTGNQQLGVALTNSPVAESPLNSLFYGQRFLTASGRATLSRSFSPRLSMSVYGSGGRSQAVSQNQASVANSALLLNSSFGSAGATINYSLSPTSQIGGTVNSSWTSSPLENMIITTSTASYGRSFGRRWVVQLHGGISVTNPVGQNMYQISPKPLPTAGGSLAFKADAHTFLGSYDHTVSDMYGIGSATSDTFTGAWNWRRPGSRWSLQSSLNWQQLQGTVASNTAGWQASAGVSRGFGPHLGMLLQYAYLKYSGGLQASYYRFSESAVRVSLLWTPQPNMLR